MTEEQEKAILEAAKEAIVKGSYSSAIVAGIKAYDDLKKEEATTNSEGCIIFRPYMRDLEDSMKECRRFKSVDEMIDTLCEENAGDICIDQVRFKDIRTGWLYSQIVLCHPYKRVD